MFFSKLTDRQSAEERKQHVSLQAAAANRPSTWRPLTSDFSTLASGCGRGTGCASTERQTPLTATSRGRSRGRSWRSGVARSAVRPRDTRSGAERKRRSRLERSCCSCLAQQGAPVALRKPATDSQSHLITTQRHHKNTAITHPLQRTLGVELIIYCCM